MHAFSRPEPRRRMMRRLLAPALTAAAAVAAEAAAGCGGGGHPATAHHPSSTSSAAAAAATAPVRTGVSVPQIAGVEIDRARHRAERAGLTLAVSGYVGKYGNGRYNVRCVKVLRQSPVAGEHLAKGSAVYVILKECRTPQTAPVPPAGTT